MLLAATNSETTKPKLLSCTQTEYLITQVYRYSQGEEDSHHMDVNRSPENAEHSRALLFIQSPLNWVACVIYGLGFVDEKKRKSLVAVLHSKMAGIGGRATKKMAAAERERRVGREKKNAEKVWAFDSKL